MEVGKICPGVVQSVLSRVEGQVVSKEPRDLFWSLKNIKEQLYLLANRQPESALILTCICIIWMLRSSGFSAHVQSCLANLISL